MKRTMALFLALALLLLTACGGPAYQAEELKGDASAAPAASAETDLHGAGADAVTAFAVELLRQTDEGGSTLLSPVSVVYALAMTANGAAGETLAQMESVLDLPLEELNAYLRTYTDRLPEETGGRCSLANSIWFRDEADRLTVEQSFLDAAAAWYDASVFSAPFDESTLRDINAWVSDHTGGRIPSIVNQIPESAMIYLINALAFEGEWEDIYREDQVSGGTFTTEDGREQPAELMYGAESAYLEDSFATGFLKYYKDRNYAFAALLPNEGVSLEDYLASLTGEHLRDLLTHPQDTLVQTAIPKFTAETTVAAERRPCLHGDGRRLLCRTGGLLRHGHQSRRAAVYQPGPPPDPPDPGRAGHQSRRRHGGGNGWRKCFRARFRLPDPALPVSAHRL